MNTLSTFVSNNTNSVRAVSNSIQHEDNATWKADWIYYDRPIVPRIPITPSAATENYKNTSCIGAQLSPHEITEAQNFVQKEWKRIYDKFIKLERLDRGDLKELNLVFMNYAYLALNSNYKKAYDEFKLTSRAFDSLIDQKHLERKFKTLAGQQIFIEGAKNYLDRKMHQDNQTQIVSKKCEDTRISLHEIFPDPHRQTYKGIENGTQIVENCTQILTECYAAISSLCLAKVKEGHMSLCEAISFLHSRYAIIHIIPIELSKSMLEKREKSTDAMAFYYLKDPVFINKHASNEEKSEFYAAKQLMDDNVGAQLDHENDVFHTLINPYKNLCIRLSHPNHADTLPLQVRNIRRQSWSFEDHRTQLEIAKEPLRKEIEKLRKLLGISSNQNPEEPTDQAQV